MVGTRESAALRTNLGPGGKQLQAADRERILKPYLPNPDKKPTKSAPTDAPIDTIRRRRRVRPFLAKQIHLLIFNLIQFIFSVYLRFRQAYHGLVNRIFTILYYHHRTPELIQRDVKNLKRLPKHLSAVLELDRTDRNIGLEKLMNDVCELCAWTASAGIPTLSIYEQTGILKDHLPSIHLAINRTLHSYFGRKAPALSLRAPHMPSFSPPDSPPTTPEAGDQDSLLDESSAISNQLSVLLISETDGRATLVDLTKTLAEMSQRRRLAPADVSAELIDAEISESTMGEPDLLLLFSPTIQLLGYPPWQLRLTEIFHVPDNEGVGYQIFLRGLYNYADAQMRFGR